MTLRTSMPLRAITCVLLGLSALLGRGARAETLPLLDAVIGDWTKPKEVWLTFAEEVEVSDTKKKFTSTRGKNHPRLSHKRKPGRKPGRKRA